MHALAAGCRRRSYAYALTREPSHRVLAHDPAALLLRPAAPSDQQGSAGCRPADTAAADDGGTNPAASVLRTVCWRRPPTMNQDAPVPSPSNTAASLGQARRPTARRFSGSSADIGAALFAYEGMWLASSPERARVGSMSMEKGLAQALRPSHQLVPSRVGSRVRLVRPVAFSLILGAAVCWSLICSVSTMRLHIGRRNSYRRCR